MNDGDVKFTPAGVAAVEAILREYVATLIGLTKKRNARGIHQSVKKVVLALNKHRSFIDTTEREELGTFVNALVAATGLEVPPMVDLTLRWRKW